MNIRENVKAILHYENYDRMPIVAFGFWDETIDKWIAEGHLTPNAKESNYNGDETAEVTKKLGFDFHWGGGFYNNVSLFPGFQREILETKENGHLIVRDWSGLIVLEKPGVSSIPSDIGTTLTDRTAWETLYVDKLKFSRDRINWEWLETFKDDSKRTIPQNIYCGSLFGAIRDLLGVEHLSYLYADDEDLYKEVIDTFGKLSYEIVKAVLESGAKFDYAHFWEDICFKNGPLVSPVIFDELVGPHYKKVTDLLNSYGIDIVSLDCDGKIDSLIPTWLENGVNTMFPIEVGTWEASITPWREQYGKAIRGVGGMNKNVFAEDYKAIDIEIERLKRMIDLGGFIPCPDHRIPPGAIFENVQYYCEQFDKKINK
ncbi:MAG: uroporphyrinogen decarboxylase family protein [Clostridia bacterium]